MKILSVLFAMLLIASTACATPTPTTATLSWDTYTDPNATGFYIYWRDAALASSAYTNANRFQLTNKTLTTEPMSAFLPAGHPSSLCFVLTAYSLPTVESAFSNETCGFTGFSTIQNLLAK